MTYQYHQHHSPAGRPRRVTAGQRIQGAVALLVVLGLTVGLPYALLFLAGNPLTNGVLDLANLSRILTSPDDGTLFMSLLQIIGWVAWIVLALSIVVELLSQLRGVRAPRLPGLGMPQGLARGLVGALMLLFTVMPTGNTVAAATGAPAHTAQAPSSVTMTVDQRTTADGTGARVAPGPSSDTGHRHDLRGGASEGRLADRGQGADQGHDAGAGKGGHVERADKEVVVESGDTLWGIAEAELGDGSKYPELYQASRDVNQPGGTRLTDPDLIRPGWTIEVPGAGEVIRPGGASQQERPAPAPQRAVDTAASAAAAVGTAGGGFEASGGAVGATAGAGGDAVEPTRAVHRFEEKRTAPGQAAGQDAAGGAQRDAADAAAAEQGLSAEVPWQVTTASGVGTLLAAGVVALLAARRRDQQRTRRPGQTMPLPADGLAAFEQTTRAGADRPSVEAIDLALRSLADHCVHAGRPLPVVRAARLTSRALELYLEAPALLPQPWSYAGDATVWTLAAADLARLGPAGVAAVPAPYPSLVTIGYDDEQGHVLLNLEHLGALGITGDVTGMDEILAAVALELATSIWADDLQVTVVGALAGLEPAMRTGRVRHLPDAGRIIDDLRRRAEDDRAALATSRAGDLYAARVTGAAPDAWEPEIVLLGGPVSDDDRAALASLVAELPHVALATITSGDVVGPWALHIEPGGQSATLAPIGLRLRPQRLPAPQYEAMLGLVANANANANAGTATGDPWPEPTVAEIEAIVPVPEPGIEGERAARVVAGVEGYTYTEGLGTAEIPVVDPAAPVTDAHRGVPAPLPGDPGGAGRPATGGTTVVTGSVDASQATFDAAHVAPRILLLGPVEVVGTRGTVDERQQDRLLELAAYLALHRGAAPEQVDAAMWPGGEGSVTVRTSTTGRLRRWFGQDDQGEYFLPRHQDGPAFGAAVTTDVDTWDMLVGEDPRRASTPNLVGALRLVRGLPFEGVHRRRYAWAAVLRERLIAEVVDASFELARRHLAEGRWRSAEDAAAVGLRIEPAQESLWRLRILAAHQSSDEASEQAAVERLLSLTERLECNLEPETEQLLASLKDPGGDFDRFMAGAL